MEDLNITNIVDNEIPPIRLMEDSIKERSTSQLNNIDPFAIQQDKSEFSGIKQPEQERLPSIEYRVPVQEAYDLVGDEYMSRFPSYMPGRDNAEYAAQNQSGWEQTINGLQKAGANIGNVIVGNTVGFVYGLADWAKTGNFSSVYDNSFSQTLNEWNEKLNYQLPNYYTNQEKEAGFFGSVGTANFWANDVMNGLSFTVGTIASEAIWAYATGGASLATRLGRIGAETSRFGKAILGAEKTAEGLANYKGFVYKALDNAVTTGKLSKTSANILAKTGEVLNTSRFIATSSGNEAGIEAFHFKKEAMENFYNNFEKQNGRQPTVEEIADITDKIEGASNNVFATNMVILGVSYLAMIGGMFNVKSPIKDIQNNINKKLFGVGVEKTAGTEIFKAVERKTWQKSAGLLYKGTSPIIREGLFEEGLQGVATKTANNWIERQYDPKYLNKVLSITDDAWKATQEQYGTKEGWKEIGIGGIVGILGGGFTGEFSQFSKMAKEQEQIVAPSLNAMNVTMNTLVSDINAKRYSYVSKVLASEDKAEQARISGDAVATKLAYNESIIATLEMHNDPIFNTDFNQLINHFNNTIDTSEVSQSEKDTIKEGFSTLVKEYKSADRFAESIVGSQGSIYGTAFQAKEVKKALTYSILQGQSAKGIMDSSLIEMQSYMNSELVEVVKKNEELESLGKNKRRQVRNLSQQYRNWEKKSEQVQKKVRELQASPNEIEGDKKSRLVEMQQKLIEIEDSKSQIRKELEVIGREASQNKKLQQSLGQDVSDIQTMDDFIAVDDLIALEDKLKEIESTFQVLKEINPISAKGIQDAMNNYSKAKNSVLTYNTAVKLISSGNFKPKLSNSPFSKLFDKFSKEEVRADDYTQDFLVELNRIWVSAKTDYVQDLQEDSLSKARQILEELNAIEGELTEAQEQEKLRVEKVIAELQTPLEEVNDDTPQKKVVNIEKELSPIEALKARIEDILKLFKTSFVGTYDIDEAVKNKPEQKDIERYRELKQDTLVQEYELSGQLPTDTSLIEEFETLRLKLSQWKVYDSLAEDDESVADLLDLVAQLETEVEQQNTITDMSAEETFNEVSLRPTESVDLYDLSVNTNYPVTVKRDSQGNYNITHMNPSTLLGRMGATNVKIGKKDFSFEEVDNQKKSGLRVDFLSGGVQRSFTIADRGRLNISAEDFRAIPNVKTIESLSSWTYPNLYEQDFEGNWIPIQSDFSDPNITGDSNNLEKEDSVELFVDVNNEYNKKLLGQKLDQEELANQVVIYIRKAGEVYGTIKGIPNRENIFNVSEQGIFNLRDTSANILKQGVSKVVATTKVKYVQLGNPILSIDASGAISQMTISDRTLKNIIATGFVQDGEINLNKSIKIEDIRRTFIKKPTEKNPTKKIPIVVIKRGKQNIAFPVQLTKTPVPKTEELNIILNDQTKTDAQKVTAINNTLIKNGISPKEFELITLDEQKVNEIADRLENNQEYKTAEQLADKSYKKENLTNDATIALDLENLYVSLPSQKFNIDLENISYDVLPDLKVEKQEVLEKIAEKEIESPGVVSAQNKVNKPKTSLRKEAVTDEKSKISDVEEISQSIVDKIVVEKEVLPVNVNLVSFEAIDYTGKPVTYYKRGNRWGYLDSNNNFESLIQRAQDKIEAEYQLQQEMKKSKKDELC